jgi:hypothetical protein
MPLRSARGRAGENEAMLEAQALLLRPWADAGRSSGDRAGGEPADSPRRAIVDPATGRPLGFAWEQPAAVPPWLHWLTAPVLEVHEAGDLPLLFTVHRFWIRGPLWEVRDADGRRVAVVRRTRVEDALGGGLAVRERGADGTEAWLRQSGGPALAMAARTADGVRFTFADAVAGEPFVKMALLAAALVAHR